MIETGLETEESAQYSPYASDSEQEQLGEFKHGSTKEESYRRDGEKKSGYGVGDTEGTVCNSE